MEKNQHPLENRVSELDMEIAGAEKKLMNTPAYVHIDASIYFTDIDSMEPQEYRSLVDEITLDLLDTPYKPGRIKALVNSCELNLQELGIVTNVMVTYSVKPTSIEKLLKGGIEVHELDGFLNLYKTDNVEISFETKVVEPFSIVKENKITYVVPNAEDYMSYDNMLFLRNMLHKANPGQIRDALFTIDNIKQESGVEMGTGVVLNRMRELHSRDPIYKRMSLDLLTRVAIDGNIEGADIYSSLDDEEQWG